MFKRQITADQRGILIVVLLGVLAWASLVTGLWYAYESTRPRRTASTSPTEICEDRQSVALPALSH